MTTQTDEQIKFRPIHMSAEMVRVIYESNLKAIEFYEKEYQEKGWARSAQMADLIINENKFFLKYKK